MNLPTNINIIIVCAFSVIMLIAFIHALKVYYINNHAKAITFYSNTLTSLGILGTFSGIALGILYFDTSITEKSLIYMIDGFKTAFITSIVGLTLSLFLKQITFLHPNRSLLHTDQQMTFRLEQAIDKQTAAYSQSQNSITQSIVESLKDIINNFNERIESQLGDNLGAVSTAINGISERMNSLNKNIGQFEEQTVALNIAVESFENVHSKNKDTLTHLIEKISRTDALFQSILEKNDVSNKHAKQLEECTISLNQSIDNASTQISLFYTELNKINEQQNKNQKNIADTFKNLYEESQKNIITNMNNVHDDEKKAYSELLLAITNTTKTQKMFTDKLTSSIHSLNTNNHATIENTQNMFNKFDEMSHHHQTFINKVTKKLLDEIDTASKKQYGQFAQAQLTVSTHIDKALANHHSQHEKILSTHYSLFEKQLANEMQDTFDKLGRIMGFVSGEFASDFQRLIDQMNAVKSEFDQQVNTANA